MVSRVAYAALCLLAVFGGAHAQEDCSRNGILAAVSAIESTTLITGIIKELELGALLPGGRGEGTLFLPKNAALIATGVPLRDFTTTLKNQTIAIIAYHSLLNQRQTYDRSALLDDSPIDTDLAVIAGALGDDNQYALTFQPGPPPLDLEGREKVLGIRGSSTIRGVEPICGYFVYPIDGVLVPAQTLGEVPPGAGAALVTALGQNTPLDTPEGLGAALSDSSITLPATAIAAGRAANTATPDATASAPLGTAVAAAPDAGAAATGAGPAAVGPAAAAGVESDSPDSEADAALGAGALGAGALGAGAAGAADSPSSLVPDAVGVESAADGPDADSPNGAEGPNSVMSPSTAPSAEESVTDGVAGAALPLNGTDGSLSSSQPVLLFGEVTSEDGSTKIGSGLVYIDGTVEDGQGVDGTATLVRRLDDNGVVLSRQSIPLEGADVSGAAISAEGFDIMPSSAAMSPDGAMSPSAMGLGAMGPSAMGPSAMGPEEDESTSGFGESLTPNEDGTLTNDGPFVLNGMVEDGSAVNEDSATGTAKDGSLGPGLIYIDGEVKDGQGVSGTAYPFVSQEGSAIAVNEDNGVDIEGATITGTGFSSIGSEPRLQGADDEGGAGAASAGSPGVAPSGGRSSDADAPSFNEVDNSAGGVGLSSLAALVAVVAILGAL